ncbi:MAG: C40 family peptidase [Xanthomonadaceae bacterium]|nr:C40 family peptidase [Xanthomonadaceae bacterium]
MPIKRLTALAGFFMVLLVSGPLHAGTGKFADVTLIAKAAPQPLSQLPVFNPSPMFAQAAVPGHFGVLTAGSTGVAVAGATSDGSSTRVAGDGQAPAVGNVTDLRKALIALAMQLRDIRYVRGGHDPSTGFDCSGFVRYVFAHAVGMQLPADSTAQFLAGLKVKRADMKPGDLVFFHIRGRRRISHVGIYISEGRFIHSPATGKSVEISSLDDAYWARHFVGAKRPEALALVARDG